MKHRSTYLRFCAISALGLVLASCGSEAPVSDAPAPPPAPEAAPAAEMPEIEPASVEDPQEDDTTTQADGEMAPETDDTNEPHDHDEDHSHGEGDEHSHDDDHEDHMHAGGEAHVHGEAEGAIIIEDETVTISLDGALASFGISEAPADTAEAETARQEALSAFSDDTTVLSINGEAGCTLSETNHGVRSVGGAANATIDYTYTCASMDDLSEITFTIFETIPSMEEINMAILVGNTQDATTLTAGANTVTVLAN